VLLGWLWFAGLQRAYPDLIEPIAFPLFGLMGVREWHLYLLAEHFTNLVPYIALVIATPGIIRQWRRFVLALVVGLAIIILVHIFMSVAVYHVYEAYKMSENALRVIVPIYLVNDALPLILWLGCFPKALSDLFGFIKWGKHGGEEVEAS